jgi:hypothetical protein
MILSTKTLTNNLFSVFVLFGSILLCVSCPVNAAQIRGFVWLDADQDGRQTQSEQGIPDVTISSSRVDDLGFNLGDTQSVISNQTGHYVISVDKPGLYKVCLIPHFPDQFFLTAHNVGNDLLDSDFGVLSHCETVNVSENQQLDLDLGIINYDPIDRPGVPVPQTRTPFARGYVFEDTGPIPGIFDGGDIGLQGIEVILVDEDDRVIETTQTDTNGLYQFESSARFKYVYVKSIPDGYKVSSLNPVSGFIRSGSIFLHRPIHNRFYVNWNPLLKKRDDIRPELGIVTGQRDVFLRAGLPLIKIEAHDPQTALIFILGGTDLVADGILGLTGIENPLSDPYGFTVGGLSRKYILYDDKLRPIMSSPEHTGSASSKPQLAFISIDSTREYHLCTKPMNDISRLIPRTFKEREVDPLFGLEKVIDYKGVFNDFDPETGCATLNSKTGFVANLLIKTTPPEQLVVSVWLSDTVDNSVERAFLNAPMVELNMYRAQNNALVASENGNDLIYFPEALESDDYFVCVNTEFKQNGYQISPLSTFDPATGCTDVFQFPEQRQTHTPSLILEPATQPTPIEPVAGNQVSGMVWLDNNGNGLQDTDEPVFARTIAGLGAPVMQLYPQGSTDAVGLVHMDENSKGEFVFRNVQQGNYYICMSREYDVVGLSVTIQDAGDDSIDNDFDASPCAYDITVTNTRGADVDLGLTGGSIQPVDPIPTNPGPGDTSNLGNISVETDSMLINHQWRTAASRFATQDSVLFFSAPTNNGVQRGVVRMRRTSNGSEFIFQEWSNLDGLHANESIHLISFPQGSWSAGNTQIEVGVADISGTRQWKTVNFNTAFSTPPVVIASLQSANGGDAVDVHIRNITTDSMQLALFEEERKIHSGHIPETVGFLLVASDTSGFDVGNPQATRIELPFLNAGILINHSWQTIGDGNQVRLEEDQTSDPETFHVFETVHVVNINGHYLTQIASANGGDPAVLRSRLR